MNSYIIYKNLFKNFTTQSTQCIIYYRNSYATLKMSHLPCDELCESLLFLPFAYKFDIPGGSMWNFGDSLASLPPTVEDHLVLVLGLRDWIWDGIVL